MHVHNVGEYAPPGYRLVRSDMAVGGVTHIFAKDGSPDLTCVVEKPTPESEVAALEAFKAKHSPATPKRSR